MQVTEEEAIDLWCPMARTHGGINRRVDGKDIWTSGSNCLGTRCMLFTRMGYGSDPNPEYVCGLRSAIVIADTST